MTAADYLDLVDWRRRVAELFAELRRRPPDEARLSWFRAQKDALFRGHPQSPLTPADRLTFHGLSYWAYDPSARVEARFVADEEAHSPGNGASRGHQDIAFHRIGFLDFDLQARALRLAALWIEGYAGGLFVPFTDATSGHETYGGGRYLLDTIKSADLGSNSASGTVELDFNYAYHPSCVYDPRWVCPLAPPQNRLPIAVRAGERLT
jgi:uncharacterized protein (DUF1684 family)